MKFVIFILLLFLSFKAISNEKSSLIEKQFIIKVIHNSVLTENWAKKLCEASANSVSKIYGQQSKIHCFLKDDNHPETDSQIENLKNEAHINFQIDLERKLDSTIDVSMTNLNQLDKNFANKVG